MEMASGGLTHTNVIASGAYGITTSPARNRNSSTIKTKANDLLDQIKQLEIEGQKLRAQSLANLGNSIGEDYGHTDSLSAKPNMTPPSPSTLSALIDITAEQKTIADLRNQLDSQRKETDRLQQTLYSGEFSNFKSVPVSHHSGLPSSPSKTGFSTLPSTELFSARRPVYDYNPPSHLEKALKDSQEQVTDLRKRLQENSETFEQHKRQFRSTIEDLKAKLQQTVSNRDSVLELRQRESTNQESMIHKLQSSVHQLQEKCKAQEETSSSFCVYTSSSQEDWCQALLDTNRKNEDNSRDKYLSETAINQIRILLGDVERKRGRNYFDSDPVSKQVPGMLVHTLERCLQELTSEAEDRKQRVDDLESEVKSLKQTVSSDKESLIKEQQEKEQEALGMYRKITSMTTEHEKELKTALERASNSRKQTTQLQSQLAMLEGQYEQQIKLKDETITELETKVKLHKEEYNENRIKWTEKKDSFDETLNSVQRDLLKTRSERDEAVRKLATLESKCEELQKNVTRANTDYESEKKRNSELQQKETELRVRQTDLENKLEDKQKDVDRLDKMLELVKQECNSQVNQKQHTCIDYVNTLINFAERQERERHFDQISNLTSQLSSITEKCNRMSLELELNRSENNNLKKEYHETSDKYESLKIQYDSIQAEKCHVTNMLDDKKSDIERVIQEKDYYMNLLEQRNEELAQVKSQKERLNIQIDEKERNVEILQKQSNNFTNMIESTSKTTDALRDEKENLLVMVQERTKALEEIKLSRDTMSKKMKIREKRIKELEEDKQHNMEELQIRREETNIVQHEKDNLYRELKESRFEVATVTEEKDKIKDIYEKQKADREREISRMQARIKAAEQEVKLAQKTMRTRDSADHQAVKVADKMQKEVTLKRSEIDSLKTKVRWLEDKLDSLTRDRHSLENDKDRLKSTLNKTLTHNQQLSGDLETSQEKVMEMKQQVSNLEMLLEKSKRNAGDKVNKKCPTKPKKAATRNATTQAELEQYEQELARLRLKHQLDLQEVIQKNKDKYPSIVYPVSPHYPQDEFSQSQSSSRTQEQMTRSSDPLSTGRSSDYDRQEKPTRDTDDYRAFGNELKSLLTEMRELVAEKKQSANYAQKASLHRCSKPPVQTNVNYNHKHDSLSSDTEYHSDAEVDRTCNRSRSRTHDYSAFTYKDNRSKSTSPRNRHRRSNSAELSLLLKGQNIYNPQDSHRIPNLSNRSVKINSYTSDSATDSRNNSDMSDPQFQAVPLSHPSRDKPTRLLPDTQELCKRLEEKIESLTKMGGTLQRENKDTAELMKKQGRKLQKVKDGQTRGRKSKR
ncbi:coiled-coil domain-containing protein 158-like isoform X2 [Mytilus californianus]|uniref:coiled-coil domain-containing protein 158-like isoform X2 n=1 Tax=Mytilus californianus TaxID=6549 RepID=UPI00224670F9|nr:coiled-coil domain-containing protein 158-like isoform X2 [Mytilus californianus]